MPLLRRRPRSLFGNQQPRKEGRLRQEEFDENLFLRLGVNNLEALCGKIAGINPRSMLLQSAIPKRRKQLFSYRKRVKYYLIFSPEQLPPSWNSGTEFLGVKSECSQHKSANNVSFRESVQSSHARNRKSCLRLARLLCNRCLHVTSRQG